MLSDRNIAEVQKRLPNRDGHVFDADLWDVAGKGDVLARIRIEVPKKVSKKQRELLEQLQKAGG